MGYNISMYQILCGMVYNIILRWQTCNHFAVAFQQKMKELVSKGKRLEKNARNLLSVAYKNLVGSKRSSWRVVRSILDKLEKDLEEETTSEGKARLAKRKKITEDFLTGIVQDLRSICTEVVVSM